MPEKGFPKKEVVRVEVGLSADIVQRDPKHKLSGTKVTIAVEDHGTGKLIVDLELPTEDLLGSICGRGGYFDGVLEDWRSKAVGTYREGEENNPR